MFDFRDYIGLLTPEGEIVRIRSAGEVIWEAVQMFRYVSLGDSIAGGHMIVEDWETRYGGENGQYGKNGNTSTYIIPNTYTDLLGNDFASEHGTETTKATSFARSGDAVSHLMNKLDQDVVKNTIKKADVVTICISANDILGHVYPELEPYINSGDLSSLEASVERSLSVLATDSEPTSYVSMFNKLNSINPNAKFIFTTIYNPYKYLWIEEGRNGFFEPVLSDDVFPQMNIDIPYINVTLRIDEYIKDGILQTPIVQKLFSRVNGLCDWVEKYVEGSGTFKGLNRILKEKVSNYNNQNFSVADTKALFDTYPDRPSNAAVCYNDLVNVEFTRGYTTGTMDWGALWRGSDAGTYWRNLVNKNISFKNASPSVNPIDYVEIRWDDMATELVNDIIDRVIVPNIDPHPEVEGHKVLKQSFAIALGWDSTTYYTVTYNANNGSGSVDVQEVVAVDNLVSYAQIKANTFTHPTTGYKFVGWNTKADGSGTSYSIGQSIPVDSNINLYAQWSDVYTLTFRHSENSDLHGSGDTGPMESYALWIDGVEQSDLGAFSNGARKIQIRYGTPVGVIAQTKYGNGRSHITMNGTKVAGDSSDARHTFTLTGDTDIHFIWTYAVQANLSEPQVSYWKCNITTK